MAEPPSVQTFVNLMAIEALSEGKDENVKRYMSKRPSFNPGGGSAYGGHVFAQAVWAASQDVKEGLVVHNVHGYFTLPGFSDRPYIYSITPLSSGRRYCTRQVSVSQPITPSSAPFKREDAEKEMGKACFVCICSFKRDEAEGPSHQVKGSLEERFAVVIGGKRPDDHGVAPSVESPWYYRHITKYPQATTIFSGLECRKPDMSLYNKDKPPSDHRKLDYYRPIGPMPTTNLNLHACAHLYASDRNSLFIVSNALGYGDEVGTMGSLSHSVVFHGTSKDLVMRDDEWWLQEAWTPRSGHGRGMHESRIWDKRGKLVASTWQDGLVRRAEREEDQRQRLLWFEGMRKMGKYSGEVEEGLGRYKL